MASLISYKLLDFRNRSKPCGICKGRKHVKYAATIKNNSGKLQNMRVCSTCMFDHFNISDKNKKKVSNLEFKEIDTGRYEANQNCGERKIRYLISKSNSGSYFVLTIEGIAYDNSYMSDILDDCVKRANEINEAIMTRHFEKFINSVRF